jgi:hypothetical protein
MPALAILGLERASGVESALLLDVALVCLLLARERAKVMRLPAYLQHGTPTIIVPERPEQLGTALARPNGVPILGVYLARYVAKIAEAIIGFVSVDVIDFVLRRRPAGMLPRQAVSEELAACEANGQITIVTHTPGDLARLSASGARPPRKQTSGRIILKKAAQNRRIGTGRLSLRHGEQMADFGQSRKNKRSARCLCF